MLDGLPSFSSVPHCLIVDEPLISRLIARTLCSEGFETTVKHNPLEVLKTFHAGVWDLLVSGLVLPPLSGHELIANVRAADPDLPVVVVTAEGSLENVLRALRDGVGGMVIKPFAPAALLSEVHSVLERSRERRESIRYRFTAPLLDGVALALVAAIEARDIETASHCRRVGEWAEATARHLGLPEDVRLTARLGGFLHDLGKLAIPDRILFKRGPLSEPEWEVIRTHPDLGADMLAVHERLEVVGAVVRHHHERWDGAGYPAGLHGEQIPIGARLVAVADTFDAMTNDRPYLAALPVERVLAELRAQAGRQLDPEAVAAFCALYQAHQSSWPRPADPPSALLLTPYGGPPGSDHA